MTAKEFISHTASTMVVAAFATALGVYAYKAIVDIQAIKAQQAITVEDLNKRVLPSIQKEIEALRAEISLLKKGSKE